MNDVNKIVFPEHGADSINVALLFYKNTFLI